MKRDMIEIEQVESDMIHVHMEAYQSKDIGNQSFLSAIQRVATNSSTAQAVILVTMMALFTDMWLVSIESPFSVLLLNRAESLT